MGMIAIARLVVNCRYSFDAKTVIRPALIVGVSIAGLSIARRPALQPIEHANESVQRGPVAQGEAAGAEYPPGEE